MINESEEYAATGLSEGGDTVKYSPGQFKLDSYNWLHDIPAAGRECEIVEVRFKNTRKGFYRNVNNLRLETGDVVAVEASPGHDIGRVAMTGRLVELRIKQTRNMPAEEEIRKVYRKAKPVDMEKWEEAMSLEIPTMLRSRRIASDLNLNMKIGDVEYQGDKTKAIFYYIADERVDFRQLIKSLAEEFRIRIEMRQIGARQEAGRIGGIGSCGRELCCSSHITGFTSITTSHARYQDLSLNPQKLAGQCGKLKCCLSYEFDSYVDRQKQFPPKEKALDLADGRAYFVKMEIYKGIYWYSFDQHAPVNITAVPVERVAEIQKLNARGIKPERLMEREFAPATVSDYENEVGKESITRFDRKKGSGGKRRNKRRGERNDKRKQ
jgi:cell fate regulator YaaT (PSP1 superfamily)